MTTRRVVQLMGCVNKGGSMRIADICAGVGGFRLAFERQGFECVYTCEINKYSRETYSANFDTNHQFDHDVTVVDPESVPDHDVLTAGFPCQAFSVAGKQEGLNDPRGQIFFYIAKIIETKKPKFVLLENVPRLLTIDDGKPFKMICDELMRIGYDVSYGIYNSDGVVPQRRSRLVILCRRMPASPIHPEIIVPRGGHVLGDILEDIVGGENADSIEDFGISQNYWDYAKKRQKEQKETGWCGYWKAVPGDVSRTLIAGYCKNPTSILIDRPDHDTPRSLTPRECARLVGFPDTFKIPVPNRQAYKQFGNSVVVPLSLIHI